MSGWLRWVLILTMVWVHCNMNEETTILTFQWQPLNRKIEDLPKMFPVSANTLVAPLDRDLTELTVCQRFKLESLVSQATFGVKDSKDQMFITTLFVLKLSFQCLRPFGPQTKICLKMVNTAVRLSTWREHNALQMDITKG
jgi:hypothetical protein